MAQRLKRLPAMRETRVQSLGREDPLEKEMATHSSIPVWEMPWIGTWRATVHGVTKSRTQLSGFTSSLLPSGKLHQCFHFPLLLFRSFLEAFFCVYHSPSVLFLSLHLLRIESLYNFWLTSSYFSLYFSIISSVTTLKCCIPSWPTLTFPLRVEKERN